MATTIYQLSDPVSGEVRYVGKTVKRIQDRLCAHICYSRYGMKNHLHNWLRSLPERPKVTALVVVEDSMAFETERAFIALFRKHGYRLVNATDGGEGAPGHQCSEEKKSYLRALFTGRKAQPRSDQWRQRMSVAKTGKKHTEEHNRKIGVAGLGRVVSEAQKEKQRIAMTGRVYSPEHCANIGASHKGIRPSEETREKMRATFTPDRREQMALDRRGKKKSRESVERGAAKLRGRKLPLARVEQIRATTTAYWARIRTEKSHLKETTI